MKHLHTYLYIAFVSMVPTMALSLCSCSDDIVPHEHLAPLNLCSPANTPIEGYSDLNRAPAAPRVAFAHHAPGDADVDDKNPFVPGTIGNDSPEGVPSYLAYNELYPKPINRDYTTIGAFLTEDSKNIYESLSGYFSYAEDNKWNTTVGIKPGEYYLFGYMPSNLSGMSSVLTMRPGSTTWADGCQLSLKNLSTVTPADVCVVVGVLKWADMDTPIFATNVVEQLKQGAYSYKGDEKDNYVYLLLDHLYTNVNFELVVEEKYSELRTIVLKQATMRSAVSNTVDAIITLGNSDTNPLDNVNFQATSVPPANAVLFPEAEQYEQTVSSDPDKPTSIPGYFAPGMTDQSFVFEFIYDVYDRQGNCVRRNCHAVNKWAIKGSTVKAGKSFKVKAMLRPTYLYQLSDPDLDNPTIEFTAPEGTTIEVIVDADLPADSMPGDVL